MKSNRFWAQGHLFLTSAFRESISKIPPLWVQQETWLEELKKVWRRVLRTTCLYYSPASFAIDVEGLNALRWGERRFYCPGLSYLISSTCVVAFLVRRGFRQLSPCSVLICCRLYYRPHVLVTGKEACLNCLNTFEMSFEGRLCPRNSASVLQPALIIADISNVSFVKCLYIFCR